MTTNQAIPRALLAHDDWLRCLIRTLVAADDVDDVAQETWVAAIERPSSARDGAESGTVMRAWLGTVARRLAGRVHRSSARRRRREASGALAANASTDGAGNVVERIESRQRLTEIVLGLDEPFRSTLLARFYENRLPSEIAAATGVSVATVRTRLHRAVGRVRRHLDARDDRGNWRAALLACDLAIADRSSIVTLALDAVAMSAKSKLFVGAAVALLAVPLLWMVVGGGGGSAIPPVLPGGPLVAESMRDSDSPDELVVDAGSDRASVSFDDPALEREVEDLAAPPVTIGRVLDVHGAPVRGVEVFVRREAPARLGDEERDGTRFEVAGHGWTSVATSGRDGAFEVSGHDGVLEVGPPYVALRPARIPGGGGECFLVVARSVVVEGIVVDEHGRGIANARITGFCEQIATFPLSLGRNVRPDFIGGRTDESGRFRLERMPGSNAVVLRFDANGFHRTAMRCPETDRHDLRIELRSLATSASLVVRGHVYGPDGSVVPGACVGCGEREVVCDERGFYELHIESLAEDGDVLFATADGFTAGTHELTGAPDSEIDLRLRPRDAALRGRVVDHDGNPIAGMQVYLWDVEHLGSSSRTRTGFHVGHDDEWIGPSATTADDGAFEIVRVARRNWRLRLLDRGRGFAMTTEPVAPDTDLVLRVPSDATGDVSGRVVDRWGRGVVGALVDYRIPIRMRGGNGVSASAGHTRSDDDGRFDLHGVPRDTEFVRASGDGVLPALVALEGRRDDVSIVVSLERRIRVFASRNAGGSEFVVLGADGEALVIRRYGEAGHVWARRWMLDDGQTEVLSIPDSAVAVVLREGEREVSRQAITLRSDQVVEIRF